ncbi:MAG TPA: bifunctional salicylyl-CoA 5-hydroxylase/oxidoreductase [Polyangiaceae bacterium]|nr:bifunctional salicylyl-CoA 5-hydroxylase/oxidoreductase [Polyangiaceae bacterium]
MKIVCIGGGPGGLCLALLAKKADPRREVLVVERNPPDVTFGFGVVFSDETLGNLAEADRPLFDAVGAAFTRWTAIDVHAFGERVRSEGHGFAGVGRAALLRLMRGRCEELGVRVEFAREARGPEDFADADLVVASDGVNSATRAARAAAFRPSLDRRRCRYIWLGTSLPLASFSFFFVETEHGIFQAHAYRYDRETSTFIAECDEATWLAAGLDRATEPETLAYLERAFAAHLAGHRLRANRSAWVNFATLRNERWHDGNVVLIGDAAHTAHFSIGSGTKLAVEDAIALAEALAREPSLPAALEAYEAERRPVVERTQKAAQDSLVWFEHVRRYRRLGPLTFALSLLTRSKRITYENLRRRDPGLVERARGEFARAAFAAAGEPAPEAAPPPMFTPLRLRGLRLDNRVVVSPMCMYSARDGLVGDFHLVHLGARALGGPGLVMTEMTCVAADARITPGCAGLYRPEHLAAWRRVVDFVHANSGAKIGLQLGHAGRKGATKLMWEGMDEPLPEGGWPLLSASPLAYTPRSAVPRAMTRADMSRVRDQFVAAARLGDEAGFDLLELHMAHGYLLASFLSPLTNVRDDEYGGPVENRARFPLEVFDAVRAAWPADKPMSVRLSATDWYPGGVAPDEVLAFGKLLRARGVDLLDVSTGQTVPDQRPVFGRMWQAGFSDFLRHEVPAATMAVGNIANADHVNTLLLAGRADLCLLGRPHLDDPHWTLHAAAQQGYPRPLWPLPYAVVDPARAPGR